MRAKFLEWWKDYVTMVSPCACKIVVDKFSHLPGCAINSYIMMAENAELRYLISKDSVPAIIEQGKKFLDKNYFKKYVSDTRNIRAEYFKKVDEINSYDLKKLSNEKLGNLLLEMIELTGAGISYYWGSQEETLISIEKRIKSILSKKFSGVELEKAFAAIITPLKFDNVIKEELDFIQIVLNNKEFTKEHLKSHGRKYSWLFINTFDIRECMEFMKKKFKRYKNMDLIKKKEEIISVKKELESKHKEIIKNIEEDISEYLNILHQLSRDRMETKFVFAGFEFLLNDFLSEISRRINIPFADMIKYIRTEEIAGILNNKIRISDEELSDRKKFYIFMYENGETIFNYGTKALEDMKKLYPELFEEKNIKEFKGSIANAGKARGNVVIVPPKDLESLEKINKKFNKGDILVTSMTQPNTILLMEKAAAFVTDEGGILCHAAIISREMNKPCIIGTKIATKVLKDGDLVEVDADKGIVRKL